MSLLKKIFVSKEKDNKAKKSCCDMEFIETEEQEDVCSQNAAQPTKGEEQ